MFMLWSHKNLASWVTPKYLKSQRGRLPPEVYARLHENRWVSLASQFITPEDIAAMHLQPWIMQTRASPDRLLQYIVATDLGLSHDRTARVVGHYDPLDGQIYVDNIRVWQGTTDQHVDIREVEEDLVQCAHDFRAHKLVIDPWQMEYVIQRLKSTYSVVPFNPNTEMPHLSQIFVNMLRSHRIVCYQESALEEELRNTIIKQTMAGWRIDHVGKKHNDIVIALGMMMREAVKGQYAALDIPGEEEFVSTPVGFRGIRTQEF
jgi:hypothetical protein